MCRLERWEVGGEAGREPNARPLTDAQISISPDPLSPPPPRFLPPSSSLRSSSFPLDLARALMPPTPPPPLPSPPPSPPSPHLPSQRHQARLDWLPPPRNLQAMRRTPRPSRPFAARRNRRSPASPAAQRVGRRRGRRAHPPRRRLGALGNGRRAGDGASARSDGCGAGTLPRARSLGCLAVWAAVAVRLPVAAAAPVRTAPPLCGGNAACQCGVDACQGRRAGCGRPGRGANLIRPLTPPFYPPSPPCTPTSPPLLLVVIIRHCARQLALTIAGGAAMPPHSWPSPSPLHAPRHHQGCLAAARRVQL